MAYFSVSWRVEVDADNAVEAARKAAKLRRSAGTLDDHYVIDDGVTRIAVDLSEEQPGG